MKDQEFNFPTHQDLVQLSHKFPQLDVSSMEIIFTLLSTANELNQCFQSYLSQFGLSKGKIRILMQLYKEPEKGLLPSEIATVSRVTRGTITGLLDGLLKEGFVERTHHEQDRRMILIRLTEQGKNLIESVFPQHFLNVRQMMELFTDQEKDNLLLMLRKFQTMTSMISR